MSDFLREFLVKSLLGLLVMGPFYFGMVAIYLKKMAIYLERKVKDLFGSPEWVSEVLGPAHENIASITSTKVVKDFTEMIDGKLAEQRLLCAGDLKAKIDDSFKSINTFVAESEKNMNERLEWLTENIEGIVKGSMKEMYTSWKGVATRQANDISKAIDQVGTEQIVQQMDPLSQMIVQQLGPDKATPFIRMIHQSNGGTSGQTPGPTHNTRY